MSETPPVASTRSILRHSIRFALPVIVVAVGVLLVVPGEWLIVLTMLLVGLAVSWLAAASTVRHQHVEAALRMSQTNTFELLEGLPDSVVVHRDGAILYANPVFAGFAGPSADELIGRNFLEFIHKDDRPVGVAKAAALLVGQGRPEASEQRYLSSARDMVIVSATSVPIRFEGQAAIATIARDITEAKKIQAQLAFADRMMSVGTLAAGLAHEVNNPLTFVIGNLDLLAKETASRKAELTQIGLDDLPEIVDDAIEGAQRVRSIISDLKTFSDTSGDAKAPLDVPDLVNASIKMAFAETNRRATVDTDFEEVPHIVGNEPSLCQVFLNLIVNAAHAVEEGHEAAHVIRVRIAPDTKGGVVVEVRDNGVGIPAENIPRLFDPFFTTRSVGEGTGLGLSVCHNIIHDHGGKIDVESEVGDGTLFRVHLPGATAAAHRKKRVFAATGRFVGIRIMVIDDEPAVGTLFKRILTPRHRVTACSESAAGLEQLLGSDDFDLIFCDILMPEVDGITLYKKTIELRPELADRFVFITGGAFLGPAQRFLDETDRPVLRKPFTPADLKRVVADLQDAGTIS